MKPQSRQAVVKEKRILTQSGRLQQIAALVYRRDGGALRFLVITSRGSGRWIIPKGWPQVGRTLAETALREAYEEAGVRGAVWPEPVGDYSYSKTDLPPGQLNHFTVAVYAVEFSDQEKNWPERDQRVCEWVSPEEAARRVDEDELRQILRGFGDSHFATAAE